ncbi:hypothetical protein SELMODRAFT_404377 [Selaginella moellendorffii]|uniref:Uncharacterized protein TPLa-1 n=1 Tax=Selaginella moellendorffii TaxID=88036 RepID=D8QV48_SELML|nr:hypothetical protein SELMODRAFT_404377 [Selaginella moellendorffii]
MVETLEKGPLREIVAQLTRQWFLEALELAMAGDRQMQQLIGKMFCTGYGCHANLSQGIEWLKRSGMPAAEIEEFLHSPSDDGDALFAVGAEFFLKCLGGEKEIRLYSTYVVTIINFEGHEQDQVVEAKRFPDANSPTYKFLDEEKFKETVHKLEQESGFFFNMKYLEDQVQNGEWDEVERYLSGFTKVDDNRYSMKIFLEIRKQKQDRARAVEILVKDLKVFASFNEDLYKELTQLLTLGNFRENEQLSKYADTKSARTIMLLELKKLIEANPLFWEKLAFPGLKASRLRTLINQSLNWQHQLCKNPRPNPDIKTLFVDHTCSAPNGARAPPPANSTLVGSLPKGGGFPPLGAHIPFQPAAPTASALAGGMANPNPPSHPGVVGGPAALAGAPNPAAMLERPRTPPPAPTVDFQTADSEHLMKRNRPVVEEVNFPGPNIQQASYTIDDIPKTVARTINQGSCVATMDFHPLQQVILLVGTNVGEIAIWDVATRERLALKTFKVWEVSVCSMPLQRSNVLYRLLSLKTQQLLLRVVWSPDGNFIGVAFNKHIVQVYQYFGGVELRQQVEVWDAVSGRNKYTFEGHEAPVYSVCPHHKESIQFIFSAAMDGKIMAWLYDCFGSPGDLDAPGSWCTTMAYNGTRLFSCGTSKEGDSFLVEWNESKGAIKRTYIGFRKRMPNVVQFDTRNCFLAVGDEFSVKFWDMDNINLLTSIDADGGLPACPRIRFNKEGSLLAVTTIDNGFKILANADGLRLVRSFEGNKVPPETKGNGASASGSGVVAIDRPVSQPVPFTGGVWTEISFEMPYDKYNCRTALKMDARRQNPELQTTQTNCGS